MKKIFKIMISSLVAAVCLIAGAITMKPSVDTQQASAAITYKTGANGASSSYQSSKYYSNLQSLSLTGDGVTDTLAVALSQLGYQEGNSAGQYSGTAGGSKNFTEYSYNMGDWGYGYGGSDYPWCATFVSWSLLQSGATTHNKMSDMCRSHEGDINYIWREISSSKWASQLNRFGYFKNSAAKGGNYQPKSGDLIFFKTPISHIGIVVYSTSTTVYTIEGNTSDSSGVDTNGGGTYYKSYSLSNSNINGYGTLPYASVASAPKVDYTGTNKTPGLYISRSEIPLGAVNIPKYTVFSVTAVDGNIVTINYGGVVGTAYVNNSNALQISAVAGSSSGGNTGGNSGSATPDPTPTPSNVLVGVDVSKWQGTIDWAKVKQDGIDFAMLRICTHDSSTHTYSLDPTFVSNVVGASAQGIKLGIYFYSYANNIEEVRAEANMIVNILKDYPATFSFPIAYDAEHASIKSFATSACKVFCDILEQNGYYAMIYSNTNWYNNVLLPASELSGIALWQAHYKTAYEGTTTAGAPALAGLRPTINNSNDGNIKIWQFTSSGIVNGIGGGCDMNIAYFDYSTIIPKLGLNGYGNGGSGTTPPSTPEPTPTPTPTTSYVGIIEKVNGAAVEGWTIIGAPITKNCPGTLSQDCMLTFNSGWVVVDGGQGDYFYSIDGSTWTKAVATRKAGEALIGTTANALGVANCDLSNARYVLSVNLSSYQGKTLNVYFAIASKTSGQLIQFLTITNVVVPTHVHSYTYTTQTVPTCETAGVEVGVCACGHKVTRTGAAARGHDYGKWQLAIAPTLTGEGLLTRVCNHDNSHIKTKTLPALNEEDYDYDVVVAPACEVVGEAEYTFEVDGKEFDFSVQLAALEHHYGVWQLTSEPTLTSEGLLTRICGNDETHSQTKVLPVLNEVDYQHSIYAEPSCSDSGTDKYSISVDGKTFTFEVATDATGHDYGAWQLTSEPTLTSEGLLTRICGNDETHSQTYVLSVLNEVDYQHAVYAEPSCSDSGTDKYSISVNGQTFTFEVTTDATGHDYGVWQLTSAPTLTSEGLLTRICGNDVSHTEKYTLPVLNKTGYQYSVVGAFSCEGEGTAKYSVVVDGQTFSFEISISASGHAYGAWQLTSTPTLTSEGLLTKFCDNNPLHTQTRALPALNETDYVYTIVNDSSCETAGLGRYTYVIEGQTFAFDVEISTTGHDYGLWSQTVAPTLTSEGILTKECGNNPQHTQTKVLPALNETDYVYNVIVPPTCVSIGVADYSVTVDGQTLSFVVVLEATGHTDIDVNDVCDDCSSVLANGGNQDDESNDGAGTPGDSAPPATEDGSQNDDEPAPTVGCKSGCSSSTGGGVTCVVTLFAVVIMLLKKRRTSA